jgi:hypothetical protein
MITVGQIAAIKPSIGGNMPISIGQIGISEILDEAGINISL